MYESSLLRSLTHPSLRLREIKSICKLGHSHPRPCPIFPSQSSGLIAHRREWSYHTKTGEQKKDSEKWFGRGPLILWSIQRTRGDTVAGLMITWNSYISSFEAISAISRASWLNQSNEFALIQAKILTQLGLEPQGVIPAVLERRLKTLSSQCQVWST